MNRRTVMRIETVIDYIENHLDEKLNLNIIAEAVHYSKYHLHRMFADTTGMTIHDYVQRRQLTEAAKLLVFSNQPIIDIALLCGYESQQAFSAVFKAMYKLPPAQYRENGTFYPLQLRFALCPDAGKPELTAGSIRPAEESDVPALMALMHLVIDGYPAMDETLYLSELIRFIREGRALVLRDQAMLIGVMAFSRDSGCIEFLGVHPQYRKKGIQKLFLDALLHTYLPGRDICMTTYREGDKADTGHRALLKQLGFAERELLVEFGYPTQRFVFSAKDKEAASP